MSDSTHAENSNAPITLSPADAAMLDALLDQRAHPTLRLHSPANLTAPSPLDPERQLRVQAWLNVIGAAQVPAPSAALLDRTVAAVQMDRMKLQAAESQSPKSHAHENRAPRRWSHLNDVAAMFIAAAILVAVLIPAVSQARQSYRRTLCATNMASLGAGFNAYSNAFNSELPSIGTSPDGNWLAPTPAGHTNTANLLPLINAHYIQPTQLVCAGRGLPDNAAATPTSNDIQNCGYSYINLFGPVRPSWDKKSSTYILADQNPLFSSPQKTTNPDSNSFNHGQKGSYLLHADGHATWEISPNIGPAGDNIWTIASSSSNRVSSYSGTELATVKSDVFLAP